MSLILKCRIKDRGDVTWPAVGEPEGFDGWERSKQLEWIRDRIREATEETRTALGITTMKTVHVSLTFKPDIMVDA